MAAEKGATDAPNLEEGVDVRELREGEPLACRLGEESVVLVRREDEIFAIGGTCTHYGGPLGQGLVVDETVRCPWHHACFSLRTGEAIAAPALNPVPVYEVEQRDGKVFVRGKEEAEPLASFGRRSEAPRRVVIVGGGAAGSAAAEMLRREGHEGEITVVDQDADAPYDRPNLSKDYLAGSAPEEWIPLRPEGFYGSHGIVREGGTVGEIDTGAREVHLTDGRRVGYDALLLATGATPIRLDVPGADLPHVHLLRSLSDCRSIIVGAERARSVVVIGASFIGMEAAASLGSRGLQVTVVAPDRVPFERTLGAELGRLLRERHEANGLAFRLGRTAVRIEADAVVLDDGSRVEAQLVVVGIGVRPNTELAAKAGIRTENGVLVDRFLETSVPGVFAAGDIAAYPDPRTGEHVRVEHWVVAQRQGQAAARNIAGRREPYEHPPFFWTRQWDFGVSYVGWAGAWDAVEVEGDLREEDGSVRYLRDGVVRAVATLGRDLESLQAERAFEVAGAERPLPPGGAA